MQFVLIGFHSVGFKIICTIFYQMVPFFQVWSIKQILALFLFSASAYYRASWIIMQLYLCECVVSVVCMCIIK